MSKDDVQISLRGFSGNRIEVVRTLKKTIVRKTARNEAQYARMSSEVGKLRELERISQRSGLFRVPRMLGTRTKGGLFSYDLEFVPGTSLDLALERLDTARVAGLAAAMYDIIDELSLHGSAAAPEASEADFLHGKLNETRTMLEGRRPDAGILGDLISEYARGVGRLEIAADHLTGRSSFCHGDLAMDNILIARNGEIYLIDPLLNGFESRMWDYSKILQSSIGHWNLIKSNQFEVSDGMVQVKSNDHMSLFHRHFVRRLGRGESGTAMLYLIVTLSRVIKYAKNEKQMCALILITNGLLEDYEDGRHDLSGSLGSMRW